MIGLTAWSRRGQSKVGVLGREHERWKASDWHERSYGKAEWLSRDEGHVESSRIKLTGILHL